MASDRSGDATVTVTLPESLDRWLGETAEREGRSREDVLLQLVSAYRKVEGLEDGEVNLVEGDQADELPDEVQETVETTIETKVDEGLEDVVADRLEAVADAVDDRLDDAIDAAVEERLDDAIETTVVEQLEAAVDDRLEEEIGSTVGEQLADAVDQRLAEIVDEHLGDTVDERVEAAVSEVETAGPDEGDLEVLESRFMDLLQDVRERVVQVKREADAKAPSDHDHAELAAVDELEALESDLSALTEELSTLEERLDTGFGNYEAVLEHLADTVERTTNRQTRLAKALVETREELRALAARDAARGAVEELKREAGRHGVRSADCADCGVSVDLGLLTRATCPGCSATFVDLEVSPGWFGSHTLETGDRPALEAGDVDADGFEHGVSEIADAGGSEAGVDIGTDTGRTTGSGTDGDGDGGDGVRDGPALDEVTGAEGAADGRADDTAAGEGDG